ncbi:hypothetical protein ACNJ7E_41990 [Rhodococcus sp. NM-2]|uniref:hypothetical protein n=1 Tax=Rhodococcus TaxID=1827 RepID=UPI0005874536|nr:hypothetical protein GO592_43160 [Rhodococcus sp. 21391]
MSANTQYPAAASRGPSAAQSEYAFESVPSTSTTGLGCTAVGVQVKSLTPGGTDPGCCRAYRAAS